MDLVVLDHDLSNARKKSKIKNFTSASYIEAILGPLMDSLLKRTLETSNRHGQYYLSSLQQWRKPKEETVDSEQQNPLESRNLGISCFPLG